MGVGIVEGGATCDLGFSGNAADRESHFPVSRLTGAINIDIETAKATVEEDRTRILHYIAETGIDSSVPPIQGHAKYKALDQAVAGKICCIPAVLKAAAKGPEQEWKKILQVIFKSKVKLNLTINWDNNTWDGLHSIEKATELIEHLPMTTKELLIWNANDKFPADEMPPIIMALAGFIGGAEGLQTLDMYKTNVGDSKEASEAIETLTRALEDNKTIKRLELDNTNLIRGENTTQWANAIRGMTALTKLNVIGCDGIDDINTTNKS